MTCAITASANPGLRNHSDREVAYVTGAVKSCDAPRPALTTGATAGIVLFPLVCNWS